MKIGPHLFAILAFGALSTNAAFAGHYSHHHARGAAAHDYGHHVNTSAKTGISTDTAPENAPDSGLKYQNVHKHHQESPVGSDGGLHRNAIGAVVDPDKMDHDRTDGGLHRNAVGALVDPNKADHDKADEHGNATGSVTHDPDTKPVIDNAPVNKLSPSAAQNKDHGSVTTALTIVRMNGLGIGGTSLNRRGIGTVALGGPAQKINTNTGALSGNMFHPRHP